MSELDQKRNEFLIKVKALAEQYWPEGSDILKIRVRRYVKRNESVSI